VTYHYQPNMCIRCTPLLLLTCVI